MKRFLLLLILGLPATAQAESWIFQPSTRPPAAPKRRVERPRENFSNRGYRFSRSTINVGGYVTDNLYLYERWEQRR